ncbi:MAG: D-sedoheptulose-7-phosphate isomerase [Planctomycetota bacterium]|jgi:D-sedoheptulose 7-phosphate isomerase
MSRRDLLAGRLERSTKTVGSLATHIDAIDAACTALLGRLDQGGTLFTAGNGGSAAQALHLAEELIGRYRGDRPALRALCLNADPTALTCIANDFGYERVFARQAEALLTPRDALALLSTSGNSDNLLAAAEVARARGTLTIGLLGGTGGRCLEHCDHAIVIAESDSAHVQEAHMVVIHLICEVVERWAGSPASRD